MYEKVSTDLNFVDRENRLRNSGKMKRSLKRVSTAAEKEPLTYSMTDRLPQTENRISDTYLPVLSRI